MLEHNLKKIYEYKEWQRGLAKMAAFYVQVLTIWKLF